MSKFLEEKKNDLITRAETVLNKAKEEKRELTDAEAQELAEIKDDVRRIKETLKLDDDFAEMKEMEVKTEGEEPKEEETEVSEEMRSYNGIEVNEAEYRAFDAYIRNNALQMRDDPVPVNMTKGANGAVIPTTIVKWIIRKVYDICPILERSQKFNVKGNLQIPFYPADANIINVDYQDEFTQMVSSSGKFGSVTLTGYLAGALTKVSRSLMNNAQIDIVAFVVDEMAYAIKRFIEKECLIGTTGKVTGLSTLTNGITSASASAITAEEVVRLHDKIKDDFQQNAIWIMHPETRTALRLLKAQTGYFLLNDDVSTPFGTSLLGKPVYVSDNMPKIEDGGAVIYYGDMHGLATKFNEDINIQVLRERFADEHADGVIGWFEFDAKVCDEQQIAKLTMAE
jgi:HK97 family phage major capsid protein